MKSLLMFWFTRVLAVSVCAARAFASGGQAEAQPTPLLQELNALARQQLDRRALTIAAIRDLPAAATRQAEVRQRVLTLIGGSLIIARAEREGDPNDQARRVLHR